MGPLDNMQMAMRKNTISFSLSQINLVLWANVGLPVGRPLLLAHGVPKLDQPHQITVSTWPKLYWANHIISWVSLLAQR